MNSNNKSGVTGVCYTRYGKKEYWVARIWVPSAIAKHFDYNDEGLEKAILEQPAVIVLDILLPGKSGFECLKKLKERKETREIPVIILSNLGQDEEIRTGLEMGAIDYLVKADFTIDEVVKKIVKAIK